jgi:hypothetical protein
MSGFTPHATKPQPTPILTGPRATSTHRSLVVVTASLKLLPVRNQQEAPAPCRDAPCQSLYPLLDATPSPNRVLTAAPTRLHRLVIALMLDELLCLFQLSGAHPETPSDLCHQLIPAPSTGQLAPAAPLCCRARGHHVVTIGSARAALGGQATWAAVGPRSQAHSALWPAA